MSTPPPKRKMSIREKAANDRAILKQEAEKKELESQTALFEINEDWRELWKGMPRFEQKDLQPVQSILVHFEKYEDRDSFSKLVGQKIGDMSKSIWHPKQKIRTIANKRHVGEGCNPRYPIYIISKGRWENRLTQQSLEDINVPYHIVVEPQEYDNYAAVVDPAKILTLPFSNLGQGSIPARNWCWEHSISIGAERHWILDDNIKWFYRLTDNLKVRVKTGDTFRAAEDFVDRYENIGLAGFQYFMFAPRKVKLNPFTLNTRIYSMILIKNDLTHRWRGQYNEDTDLSLRVLKDGMCTVLFNAFLGNKATTMKMKGGNTDELYKQTEEIDGRRLMAESLYEQHPDVITITRKWGRWQYHVDYSPFEHNKLILKPDAIIPDGENSYGMKLVVAPPPPKGSPIKKSAPPVAKKPAKEFNQDYWKKQGFQRVPEADIQNL
jgi:hypothetical protein